jgi:hypothetical protein
MICSRIITNPKRKNGFIIVFVIITLFNLRILEKVFEHLNDGNDNTFSRNNQSIQAFSNGIRESSFQHQKIREYRSSNIISEGIFHPDLALTTNCKRWAVVTTTSNPTKGIKRFLDMPSWCLVIVADQDTPLEFMEKFGEQYLQEKYQQVKDGSQGDRGNLEKIFFLSREKQMEWEKVEGSFGAFVRSMPWDHLSRKNVGYVFALLHGAEYIFDFDDDVYVKLDDSGKPHELIPTESDPSEMKLESVNIIMQGPKVFNHHPIMGASVNQSWARGFPMEHIDNEYTQGKIAYQMDIPFASPRKDIGVIQFLVDEYPDIDAMHHVKHPLPTMTFRPENVHPVLVPTHVYAPYNSHATIHTKNALWATLLPTTVPGRISDVWRSYFSQCIFADAGLELIFSPPTVVREYPNQDNIVQDNFHDEQDLYKKSGALIDFLSKWDSIHDNIPERMKQLWIDLYEYGYIELEDVHAVQAWLGTLSQIGYEFPPLKRRFRNVAVMGQFNYADNPSTVDDVIFWAQKNMERFHTVLAAGPFSADQMKILADNSIHAISNHNDTVIGDTTQVGYYSPLENLKNTLLYFKNSQKIEGVLYAHDDAILNITELSNGQYPFPADSFISNRFFHMRLATSKAKDVKLANKYSYRIFPDGHLENFSRTASFDSIEDMYHNLPLKQWPVTMSSYCGLGQTELAKDPDSAIYREEDGSILFSRFLQSDALFVPTKYADEFARAAELHLKHKIWIECSVNTIVDMVQQRTNATLKYVKLCTNWKSNERGTDQAIDRCLNQSHQGGVHYGFVHPFKLGRHGYKKFNMIHEQLQ